MGGSSKSLLAYVECTYIVRVLFYLDRLFACRLYFNSSFFV